MRNKIRKQASVLVIALLYAFVIQVSAQRSIKILAIGNSFSEDAVENYLYNIAAENNIEMTIGNMYIAGCSLEMHWQNADNNSAAYAYRKIVNGSITRRSNTSLYTAITDENWDYITFQQVSTLSGLPDSYFPYLTNLLAYVKSHATNLETKYALHQTWAYAQNSSHSGFNNYGKNQLTMYNAIVGAVNQAANTVQIDMVIPAGTAIQNGRTSFVGDDFCRDGYHLSIPLGRYTAACTWFEKITGESVTGTSYKPDITDAEKLVAQHAAHYAVSKPNEITSMEEFTNEDKNAIIPENPIKINFGGTSASAEWNNLNLTNKVISGLKDTQGNDTGIKVEENDAFSGVNTVGVASTTTDLFMPQDVSSTSIWGYSTGTFGTAPLQPTGGYIFSRLNQDLLYDFYIYASRKEASDNRETCYIISGENKDTLFLNASNNATDIVIARNIKPTVGAKISLEVKPGSNNTNAYNFYYLNAMQIVASATGHSNVNKTESNSFRFYPNPVSEHAFIESDVPNEVARIYNTTGQIVFVSENIRKGYNQLDLSRLNQGVYLLRVNNECVRFLKQ